MSRGAVDSDDGEPFLAVPTRAHALLCLGVTVFLFALFMIVYSGANYITGLRATHLRIDFAFEHRLPFVPELSLIYSSLYFMFVMIPFALRTTKEIKGFTIAMATVTLIAGVCFLLLPAEVGFLVPERRGLFPAAFDIADQVNLTYNLCPSLHVAYSVTSAEAFRRKHAKAGLFFHGWALAVAISAWLTYQHHLVDLVAGYALGVGVPAVMNWRSSRGPRQEVAASG